MNDDLFGGLGGDTAEFGNIFHFLAEFVTHLHLGIEHLGSLEGDLGLIVFGGLDNATELEYFDFAQFFVIVHFDIAPAAVLFPGC